MTRDDIIYGKILQNVRSRVIIDNVEDDGQLVTEIPIDNMSTLRIFEYRGQFIFCTL